MFEIDGNPVSRDGLDLAETPFSATRVADQHSWFEKIDRHQSSSQHAMIERREKRLDALMRNPTLPLIGTVL